MYSPYMPDLPPVTCCRAQKNAPVGGHTISGRGAMVILAVALLLMKHGEGQRSKLLAAALILALV